jgi:menaquinol-cytochrome c reductase iron-sulfur subunit
VTDNPTNPTAETGAAGDDTGRRKFLSRLSIGLGSLAALIVGLPTVLDVLKPMVAKEPRVWRKVGAVDSFKVGQTVEVSFENAGTNAWAGKAGATAAYLRRDGTNSFTAFTVNCSHLGCPVRWEPKANMYLCPCHGGVYYANGDVAAGPPPRPLARYPVRVTQGNVEILTTPLPIDGRVPRSS